jgi:transposase
LAPAHAEAVAAVQAAPVKHADETSWKQAGRLCWLWTAVNSTVACFLIHARRGAAGLTALLGETITGIVCSDRWGAYERLGVYQRQLCWAHLVRNFQALVDRGGRGQAIGEELLCLAEDVFHWWYRVRDGTMRRATLRTYIDGQRPWLRALLARGSVCGCAKTEALCRDLQEWEPALWTFVRVEGVEPTNNAAERALRPAVLWRRRSFGCHSEGGCRFVERMLTAVQTLRLQERGIIDYLVEAITAHRQGSAAPQLLPAG